MTDDLDAEDPRTGRTDDHHCAARYSASDDPYDLEHRWYERRKRALAVACLGREHYEWAFEPGCAIGLLTAVLAPRCAHLLAVDVAPGAIEHARARLDDQEHVTIARMSVPEEWPEGSFDLVVLSEIGHYLEPSTLVRLRDKVVGALVDGGELLTVHWRGRTQEHILHGDEVHDVLRDDASLRRVLWHVEDGLVIESFSRM